MLQQPCHTITLCSPAYFWHQVCADGHCRYLLPSLLLCVHAEDVWCVCLCLYMHVCLCTHVYTDVCTHGVCLYVREYIHVHVFAFAYVYVYIPVCVLQKDVPKILEACNINANIDLFVQERAKGGKQLVCVYTCRVHSNKY